MLSQKTRYAIRAMQHLADHYGKGPVQLADIAVAQKIPPKFLTVILSELSRSGLVASQRGKDGGYWLGVSPIDISYGDLIRIMRGSLALVPCASRYAHETCKNCVEEENCRTRALMLQVRDKTANLLDGINLTDIVDVTFTYRRRNRLFCPTYLRRDKTTALGLPIKYKCATL
jgi:Rrf2 family protein